MSPKAIGKLLTLPFAIFGQIVWGLICGPIGLFFLFFDRPSWEAPMDWFYFWNYFLTPLEIWWDE